MNSRIARLEVVSLAFLMPVLSSVYWAFQKEAYFWDEIYTYEGAKYQGLSCNYWIYQPGFVNHWYKSADYYQHITTQSSDLFINNPFSALWKALGSGDLYYTLINLVQSFTPGVINKWAGICLNLSFFIPTIILVYIVSKRVLNDCYLALAPVLVYGLSAGAISTVIYIRAYMAVTFFVMLFWLLQLVLFETDNLFCSAFLACINCVVMYISLRFHTLAFLFEIIMFSVYYFAAVLKRKKDLIVIGLIYLALGPVMGMTVLRGWVINVINGGGISQTARTNIISPSIVDSVRTIYEVVRNFYYNMLGYSPYGVVLTFVLIVVILLGVEAIKKEKRLKEEFFTPIVGIISVVFYIIVYAFIFKNWYSFQDWRFFSFTYPITAIGVVTAVILMGRDSRFRYIIAFALLIAAVIIVVYSYKNDKVANTYNGTTAIKERLNNDFCNMKGVINLKNESVCYLYLGAFLWPDNMNVFVAGDADSLVDELNSLNDGLVLLWTTENTAPTTISQIEECTAYRARDMVVYYPDNYSVLEVYVLNKI